MLLTVRSRRFFIETVQRFPMGYRRHSLKLTSGKASRNSRARRSGENYGNWYSAEFSSIHTDTNDHTDYALNNPAAVTRGFSAPVIRPLVFEVKGSGETRSIIFSYFTHSTASASVVARVSQSQLVIFLFSRYRSVAPECCKRESIGDERSQGGVLGAPRDRSHYHRIRSTSGPPLKRAQ